MTMAERDMRPTEEIVAEALRLVAVKDDDEQGHDYWNCIRSLQSRGGLAEFDVAQALISAANSSERVVGADILGQLGVGTPTFVDETVASLIAALNDPVADVIESAVYSLGHRRSALAIEPLIRMAGHPNPNVRHAVAFGLGGHEDRRAADCLIGLCSDEDADVRDWASFGLAVLCSIDYPELRALLHSLLSDANPEIRGQALIGLARRSDISCMDALRAELRAEFNGIWAVEAAGHFADPSLIDDLEACRLLIDGGQPGYFISQLEDSIEACRRGIPIN